jgi:hypothetical protein
MQGVPDPGEGIALMRECRNEWMVVLGAGTGAGRGLQATAASAAMEVSL